MTKPLLMAAVLCRSAIALLVFVTPADAQLASIQKHDSHSGRFAIQPSAPDGPAPAWELDPAEADAGSHERPFVPPTVVEHYGFLSRMSVGSSLSFFGIGANGVVILNESADARVDTNWFFHNTGKFEVSGVNVDGAFHFVSIDTKLDWYPTRSMWRLSPGLLFYNGNRASATLNLAGGTSFGLNGNTYWSAAHNSATGAGPLTGDVRVGLNNYKPAFTVSGGFGRFVPHSHRHWSFPTEFGVAFTGPPTLDVNLSGWVCSDAQQTQCSNVADTTNPVGAQFQQNLNAAEVKWRHNMGVVHVYPILSTAFMYSFDLPGGR